MEGQTGREESRSPEEAAEEIASVHSPRFSNTEPLIKLPGPAMASPSTPRPANASPAEPMPTRQPQTSKASTVTHTATTVPSGASDTEFSRETVLALANSPETQVPDEWHFMPDDRDDWARLFKALSSNQHSFTDAGRSGVKVVRGLPVANKGGVQQILHGYKDGFPRKPECDTMEDDRYIVDVVYGLRERNYDLSLLRFALEIFDRGDRTQQFYRRLATTPHKPKAFAAPRKPEEFRDPALSEFCERLRAGYKLRYYNPAEPAVLTADIGVQHDVRAVLCLLKQRALVAPSSSGDDDLRFSMEVLLAVEKRFPDLSLLAFALKNYDRQDRSALLKAELARLEQ